MSSFALVHTLVPPAIPIQQASIVNALKAACIVAVIFLFCNAIYNRFFHPLRHFPGPFWGSVTDFYKLYIVAKKDAHVRGIAMHRKYGPVVRVAPNLLAFSDARLLPEVYHRKVDKTPFYSTGVLGEVAPPFQTLKHKDHAAKRKRIAPSFSMSNLRRLESDMDGHILEFNNIIRDKFATTARPLDFSEWSRYFVYDLVTHLAFGAPLGFVKQGRDISDLIKEFHTMAPLAGFIAALPWLANPILKNPISRHFLMPRAGDNTGTGRIMKFRDEMLEERLKNRLEDDGGDFLGNILKARNADGALMSIEEVKAECFVLMVAASDTTSAFICPFVNYVSLDPNVYLKLLAEISDFEGQGKLSDPVVKYDETCQMPYFMACVKETLRYSPSTPMIMPRYVSEGGKKINGIWVPGKTEIGANPYVVHRDTSLYGEDAHLFRPERWLEDEARAQEMEKHLMSFGYGSRVCLGKNIAQLETQKLCCQLFRDFIIEPVDRNNPWTSANLAIMVYWDQWINFKERKHTPKA